ncbi:MAG TPA: helix-turn-helix transcriptional regulator [Spirillospora sp.]|nr:helix-turn-helix transcriptional regulator [Spirillospora sp.]
MTHSPHPGEPDLVTRSRTSDGYIIDVRRRDHGRAIRQAMDTRGLSIKQLARRTELLDGKGVNWRTIGFLVSQWASGRETTTYRNAALIAAALDVPLALLFDVRTSRAFDALAVSTERGDSEEAS